MARKIYLTGNYRKRYTVVDDEDYEFAKNAGCRMNHRIVNGKDYPAYISIRQNKQNGEVLLHRAIAERAYGPCPPGHQVDHINHNWWDNRRSNLRYIPADSNRRRWQEGKHYYKERDNKWRVKLVRKVNGKFKTMLDRKYKTENEARLVANLFIKGYKIPKRGTKK